MKWTLLNLFTSHFFTSMTVILPPCSITWTVIPCLSHITPFVGHMGITDSKSMQYDFGGPCYVHQDTQETIFGEPCRYYQFDLTPEQKMNWDEAIQKFTSIYSHEDYNFITNNCHHFVAKILTEAGVDNKRHSCASLVLDYRFKMGKLKNFCC